MDFQNSAQSSESDDDDFQQPQHRHQKQLNKVTFSQNPLNELSNSETSESIDPSQSPSVTETLPSGYDYVIQSQTPDRTIVRINIAVAADCEEWLKTYQNKNKVTFRLDNGNAAKGRTNIYKRYYRCQHDTRPRSCTADTKRSSKNTICPARLTITIKRTEKTRTRVKVEDKYLPLYPCIIELKDTHNHQVISADALRHRDVPEEVKLSLQKMFENGHSPSSAHDALKMDLQLIHGPEYAFVASDRAICPDLQYIYRLYYKIFKKSYGTPSGKQMLKDLEQHIEDYNNGLRQTCAVMTTLNKDMIVAICTPLMKRCHANVRQSGELVFIDSSGGLDRYQCRIFLLLTHSCAGGLPLGAFITTSETRDVITSGIELLRSIFPDDAFYGRGQQGPVVFLSDDCLAERQAIHSTYPNSTVLLCVFHILQAVWRYLWEAKNKVPKENRTHLLGLVKGMVYAQSIDDLENLFLSAKADPIASNYTKFLEYVEDYYERREVWAICLRSNLPIRGNNTNNFVEAAMRVLKEKVFFRVRAFNVVQLIDFILTRHESYYERRLLDIANNRLDMALSKRFLPHANSIPLESVVRISNNNFTVKSQSEEGVEYSVDMLLGMCSCYVGKTGAPCKHQFAVVTHYHVDSFNFVPVTSPALRKELFTIATGSTCIPEGWFSSLRPHSVSEPVESAASASTRSNDQTEPGTNSDTQLLRLDSLELQCQMEVEYLDRTAMARSCIDVAGEADIATVKAQIMQTATDFCMRLDDNPTLLSSAKSFIQQSSTLVTDSALASALACFGKYTGAGLSVRQKYASKCQGLPHGPKIGVQPTAIARRQSAMGGRRCLISGRPATDSLIQRKPVSERSMPRLVVHQRPPKAPHSLSQCVQNSQSIGRTHNAK